jgi:NADH-quinone oxidoreductase subunit L
MQVVAWIGGFTALFAALIALVQNDIKRILAYSTISQLGYMMLALGLGGLGAGMFHLTTHAAFKALLFLCAGSVIHALATNDIWQMGGLVKKMPVTTITFFAALLAISGIFPFSGFWSKDEILATAQASGNSLLYALALGTAFLTAFYMSRLFFVAFTGKTRSNQHAHESPASMTVPLVILAILSVGLGAIGIPWLGWNIQSFLGIAGSAHEAAFDPVVAILSNGVALAGILIAFLIYKIKLIDHSTIRKRAGFVYALLYNKFYIDELYMFLIRNLFHTLARAIVWFDRHVVDGAVNLVGWSAKKGGDILRLTITGKIQTYALIAFCGVVAVVVVAILFDPQILSFLGGAR